jgi:hypothetical protein
MITYTALATDITRNLQAGGLDAYGQVPERRISQGDGVPCRHCLEDVAQGEAFLLLAHRPFESLQAYAETGPIFLHARACARAVPQSKIPAMLAKRKHHLVKGYSADHRIVEGTGTVVPAAELDTRATEILRDKAVAYLHVRSALNNCYTCRIDRA